MRKALNIPLEEFLRPFFGPGERICLRIFDDRNTAPSKGPSWKQPSPACRA